MRARLDDAHARGRSVAMIRLIRASNAEIAAHRPRRIPRQKQPDAQRRAFFEAIVRLVCEPARAGIDHIKHRLLMQHMAFYANQHPGERHDADKPKPPPLPWVRQLHSEGGRLQRREAVQIEHGTTDPKGRSIGTQVSVEKWAPDPKAVAPRFKQGGVRTLTQGTRNGEDYRASGEKWHENVEAAKEYAERYVEERTPTRKAPMAARPSLSLVDDAQREFDRRYQQHDLHDAALKIGQQVDAFQKEQLNQQLTAAMGVSFSAIEKPVRDAVPEWAAVNADLIQTIPERYFDRIRAQVENAYSTGMRSETLADEIQESYGVSESNAARIARDQVGKLNASVNQARQRSLGITQYIWRGMNDERERPEHDELEGETFEYDDPPPADVDGGPANPGEAIECRCYAEPDIEQLLADTEPDDDEDGDQGSDVDLLTSEGEPDDVQALEPDEIVDE